MLVSETEKCFALRHGEFKLLLAHVCADECRPMLNAIWFNLARQQVSATTGAVGMLAQVGTLNADAPKGRHVFLERNIAAKALKAATRKSWIIVHVGRDNVKVSVRTTKKRRDGSDDPFLTIPQMIDGTTADSSVDTQDNGAHDSYPRTSPSLELLIEERERAKVTHAPSPIVFNPYQLRVLTQLGEVCDELHIAIHGERGGIFARAMSRDSSDTLWTTIVMPMHVKTTPRARKHLTAAKANKRRSAA